MTLNADIGRQEEGLSEAELVERVQARTTPELTQGALQELSRRKSPRRLEVFRVVLEDPEQDSRTKRTAAVKLGKERLPGNQELLLSQLVARDAPLFAKVVQSLGQIGDEQALVRLEDLERPESATAIKALEFAKSLLAYRLHLDRHLISPPSDEELVEVTEGIPFEAEAAGAEAVQEALQIAGETIPAVALTEEGAIRLACGSDELLLLFADELRQPGSLEALRTRSALPLVLLRKGLSLDRYFLEQYFFTQPAEGDGRMALLGVRPGGELTYAGRIQVSVEGFRFTLRSVDSRYVPAIEVEGHYDTAKRLLELTKTIASSRVAARERLARTPLKASPPVG